MTRHIHGENGEFGNLIPGKCCFWREIFAILRGHYHFDGYLGLFLTNNSEICKIIHILTFFLKPYSRENFSFFQALVRHFRSSFRKPLIWLATCAIACYIKVETFNTFVWPQRNLSVYNNHNLSGFEKGQIYLASIATSRQSGINLPAINRCCSNIS